MAQVSSEKRLVDHVCCLGEEVDHLHKLFVGPLALMHKVLSLQNLESRMEKDHDVSYHRKENKFMVRKGEPGSSEYGRIQ